MGFLKGILLGLTLQLSVGPVFFALLHKAVTEGSREAFKMTLGVALVDALYIAVSFTGIAALLEIRTLQGLVLAAGAAILVFFGLRYFRKAWESGGKESAVMTASSVNPAHYVKPAEPARSGGGFGSGSFAYGLKLTAVNPLTVVFWSGTFGALLASGLLDNMAEAVLYAAGCVTATLLFLGLVSCFGRFLPLGRGRRTAVILDCTVGAVLVIFGCVMLYRLFTLVP